MPPVKKLCAYSTAILNDEYMLYQTGMGGDHRKPAQCTFKSNRRTIHKKSTGRNTGQIFMEVHLARKKKLINNTNIPDHEIEKIARCLLPDILAFYNSEDGQKEFKEWLIEKEKMKKPSRVSPKA